MKKRKYNVTQKREKKRDEIALAAAGLFMEKGFDRVRFSDIASEAHLGRTTIYEYFTNKDEILATYLEREMGRYHERAMAVLEKKIALREKLKEFIALQLEYGSSHRGFSQLFRSLSVSSAAISSKVERFIREKHNAVYSALTGELSTAIERKEIRNIPPTLIMQLLINSTSFPIKGNSETSRTADEVLSIFWSGIS